MAEPIPSQVPVSELPDRLGLSRARIYDLMGALHIQPRKVGRSAFIDGDQYGQLLRCREAIAAGQTLAQYLDENPPPLATETTAGLVADTSTPDQLLAAMLALVERQALPAAPPPPDPVDALERRLRILSDLANSGMAIPNAEMAALLAVSPATLRSRGQQFLAYGLMVTRQQQGRSIVWTVSRHVGD